MAVSWGIQLTETGIRSGTVPSLIHGKSFGRKYPKNNEILKKKEVSMEENGLRLHRLKLKLMQQDVADRVGIPLLSYQRYESGSRSPRINTAMRIAKALNTNVYEIWKDF